MATPETPAKLPRWERVCEAIDTLGTYTFHIDRDRWSRKPAYRIAGETEPLRISIEGRTLESPILISQDVFCERIERDSGWRNNPIVRTTQDKAIWEPQTPFDFKTAKEAGKYAEMLFDRIPEILVERGIASDSKAAQIQMSRQTTNVTNRSR